MLMYTNFACLFLFLFQVHENFSFSLKTSFYYNIYGIKFSVFCVGPMETDLVEDLGDRLYRADAEAPATALINRLGVQT